MSKNIVLFFVLLFASAATIAPFYVYSVPPEDDWPMPRHDPAHTGYTTTEALTTAPDAIWSKPGGWAGVFASPSVVNGVVYITSADFHAFNASTGEEIWSVSGGG